VVRSRWWVGVVGIAAILSLALAACNKPSEEVPAKAPAGKSRAKAAKAAAQIPALFNAMPEATVFAVALTDLDRFRAEIKKTAPDELFTSQLLDAKKRARRGKT